MQADGEQQQDNADLGQLVSQCLIRDEARRERTGQDAGEQITDQRRSAQPVRRKAETEREDEPRSDRRDEWRFVFRHRTLHLVRVMDRGKPAWFTDEAMSSHIAMRTAGAVGYAAVSGNPLFPHARMVT